jgi:hypothetical protein
MPIEKKYFTPAAGLQVIDPLTRKPVPTAGKWVPMTDFWWRRVGEGSGTVSDQAPATAAPAEPPRLAPRIEDSK